MTPTATVSTTSIVRMAQITFVDGDYPTAADLNTYCAGEGGAWTSWTPTITQGASSNIAKTVTYAKYARYGRTIHFVFALSPTASGTSGSPVTITLPATAASASGVIGAGWLYDTSTTTRYAGAWTSTSTSVVALIHDAGGLSPWGTAPSLAIASGDSVWGQIAYEAAS